MLCQQGVLSRPLLYLSYFFKRNRAEYYDRLQEVRLKGRWEEWLDFFLRGVIETSNEAWDTARAILELMQKHRQILQERRASPAALRAHELLWRNPIVTVPFLRRELHLTFAGANGVVERLVELGMLVEQTGFRRNRRFAYSDYLRLFVEGTEAGAGRA
jgi:Fic family protein